MSEKNHKITEYDIKGQGGQAAKVYLDLDCKQQLTNLKTQMNSTRHELHQRHTGKQAQSYIRQQIINWFSDHAWATWISNVITLFACMLSNLIGLRLISGQLLRNTSVRKENLVGGKILVKHSSKSRGTDYAARLYNSTQPPGLTFMWVQ